MKYVLASAFISITACGTSDPLEPGSGDQFGTGTQTLLVKGTVSARPRVNNAKLAADFDSEFRVQLSLGDVPVSTGSVTMRSAMRTVPLAWRDNGQGTGQWEASAAGYDEVYQLDVSSGGDNVSGVIVDGPDIHTITAPTAGAALDSTQAITVTWDRIETTDEARISAENDGIVVPDSGTYTMSPRTLRAEKDKTKTNRLRITRTNRVSPAGAVAGSSMAVSVANEIEVVAMPCPSC